MQVTYAAPVLISMFESRQYQIEKPRVITQGFSILAVREGIVHLSNLAEFQYVMWSLFLTHRNTHHLFNTD